jgi:hypothetical protein
MPIPFAAIGAGIGALGGLTKMIGGARRKKKAERALRDLQRNRQDFTNITEGQRISMRGAEFAREGVARNAATSAEALRSGGVRGVVGGMQGVQEANNQYLQQEAAQLDQQQVALDRQRMQDEARIRSMEEQRQMQDEANAQAAINAGQQDFMSGMGDIAGSAFGAGALMAGGGGAAGAAGAAARDPRDLIPVEAQSYGLKPMQGYPIKAPAPDFGMYKGFGTLPSVFTGNN